MERKMTQRIIGILVIGALFVIILPLLFNGNTSDAPVQTADAKAPPFPDQAANTTPQQPLAPVPDEPEQTVAVANPAPQLQVTPPVATVASAPAPVVQAPAATPVTPAVVATPPVVAEKVEPAKPKKLHAVIHQEPVKLKGPAWAIQMGCFKNKTNATRLADRLRAEGFKAFTREASDTMRVYVGPESKQASAASLANKIEEKFNMKGIVVSYKPLEI